MHCFSLGVYTTILSHYALLVQTPETKLHILLKMLTRNPWQIKIFLAISASPLFNSHGDTFPSL